MKALKIKDPKEFAINMSELLYQMRVEDLNNSMIITENNEQIPVDFIDGIVDNAAHAETIKKQIFDSVLESVEEYRTDDGEYRYKADMYDHAYLVDHYVERQYLSTKTKCVYLCMYCGSDNVQVKAWVKPNHGHKFVDEIEGDELGWCDDCQNTVDVQTAELKKTAVVQGYQVVGDDSSPYEGDIHPDMDASFCLYSLSQARQMIGDDLNWRLLTIWEGDVEEPTMMFEGDPRQ